MERNCLNKSGIHLLRLSLFVWLLVAIGGCGKESAPPVVSEQKASSQTNESAVAGAQAVPLTPEEKEAAEMRDLLDDGQTLKAIRLARNLMDSEDKSIRSQVLETLSWIGHRALSEITEMVNDSDPDIAEEALSAWDQAFSEISGEHRQAATIAETVAKFRKPDHVNAVLQHATELEERIALPMLAQIIDANSTNFIGECAREMYKHISGGEIYESLVNTKQFLKESEVPTISKPRDKK